MPEQLPSDAIELTEAISRYGHSREWYRNHVTIYFVGLPRKGYVSESEVKREHDVSQRIIVRPPDKDGKDD